jgi:crossover junction endodeoxyribonuclease RusA
MIISVLLPIRTVSEANLREHWGAKAKRAKQQRATAKLGLYNRRGLGKSKRLSILIVRIGARKLDSDNLARSAKAVRDGIADALGVDDGDEKISWFYGQEIGKPYSVRVEIEEGVR